VEGEGDCEGEGDWKGEGTVKERGLWKERGTVKERGTETECFAGEGGGASLALGAWGSGGPGIPVTFGIDQEGPDDPPDVREKIREALENGVRRMNLNHQQGKAGAGKAAVAPEAAVKSHEFHDENDNGFDDVVREGKHY
jgi:hypothetical protein